MSLPSRVSYGGMFKLFALLGFALSSVGCEEEAPTHPNVSMPTRVVVPIDPEAARVLVVRNLGGSSSKAIADYYVKKRGIPPKNVVEIDVGPTDEIPLGTYQVSIEGPIKRHIKTAGLTDSIDFIVLTKGIPLRIKEGGYSVDSFLVAMDKVMDPVKDTKYESFKRVTSPYYGLREGFTHKKFGLYLVTRLDGYSAGDAMRLVDNALGAKPNKGVFLLDEDPRRAGAGYNEKNQAMKKAASELKGHGFDVVLDESEQFLGRRSNLAGYYSWGSNDYSFDRDGYKALTFLPGAIAETAVSTSGRTFWPTTTGQSLIADLIAGGVTGVKGYVSEPYTIALCPADILFDRYTSGFTLAESFYMATPFLKWKDIVIGDPLCKPYPKR